MRVITTPNHQAHQSPYEIWNGEQTPHQEIPARVENIIAALENTSHELVELEQKVPMRILRAIHSSRYLNFLSDFCPTLNDGEYKYPSVFALHTQAEDRYKYPLTRLGFYSFDIYTPLSNATFRVALDSASAAYQAAFEVKNRGQKVAFALCRPPGHHAEPNQMGGYCYLNNAAVAAQFFSQFGKVATLDVDFHHGNGTQHIFYDREDVLTVSLHADPDWKFPHFSGYADEKGTGDGDGFNLNLPLQQGTTNSQYQRSLVKALTRIKEFGAEYLVVSFGADTHADDPIGGFALTTKYFTKMAQTIAELNLPTVIVMEGGYNTSKLGDNVVSFLSGFEK